MRRITPVEQGKGLKAHTVPGLRYSLKGFSEAIGRSFRCACA